MLICPVRTGDLTAGRLTPALLSPLPTRAYVQLRVHGLASGSEIKPAGPCV